MKIAVAYEHAGTTTWTTLNKNHIVQNYFLLFFLVVRVIFWDDKNSRKMRMKSVTHKLSRCTHHSRKCWGCVWTTAGLSVSEWLSLNSSRGFPGGGKKRWKKGRTRYRVYDVAASTTLAACCWLETSVSGVRDDTLYIEASSPHPRILSGPRDRETG